MVTAAFYRVIYGLFAFTVAAGRPPFHALGKYLPNRLRVHPNSKFFVGICIGKGKVQRESLESNRCQRAPRRNRNRYRTSGGKNCIRNHGNTNTNAHS